MYFTLPINYFSSNYMSMYYTLLTKYFSSNIMYYTLLIKYMPSIIVLHFAHQVFSSKLISNSDSLPRGVTMHHWQYKYLHCHTPFINSYTLLVGYFSSIVIGDGLSVRLTSLPMVVTLLLLDLFNFPIGITSYASILECDFTFFIVFADIGGGVERFRLLCD